MRFKNSSSLPYKFSSIKIYIEINRKLNKSVVSSSKSDFINHRGVFSVENYPSARPCMSLLDILFIEDLLQIGVNVLEGEMLRIWKTSKIVLFEYRHNYKIGSPEKRNLFLKFHF